MSTTEYDFAAYAAELVKGWPPLSERQKVRITNIFYPERYQPEPADLAVVEAEMEARERHDQAKAVHDYVDRLLGCEGCGRPPKAHGPDSTHQWTPTSDTLAKAQEK